MTSQGMSGLTSLRLTSNLAAAVFTGLGHPPLPGMFKWDPVQFEEEMRRLKRLRRKQKVVGCLKRFVAFLFSHVGLAGMVIVYSIVGGFIFQAIEQPKEIHDKIIFARMKHQYIDNILRHMAAQIDYYKNCSRCLDFGRSNRSSSTGGIGRSGEGRYGRPSDIGFFNLSLAWNATSRFLFENFLLFQENVTEAVKSGGWDGKDETEDVYLQWSFAGALLYVVTVITTIGYGHIAPKTKEGRLLTIVYALIGIPLTFLYLSNIGNFLADSLKKICCGVCCCLQCKRKKDREIMRLRRKQRLMTARRELSLLNYASDDPRPQNHRASDTFQTLVTDKTPTLSPSSILEKQSLDKDASGHQCPPSVTSTSLSHDSSDKTVIFVGSKTDENNKLTAAQEKYLESVFSQSPKFECSVTITPPEEEGSKAHHASKKRHRSSLPSDEPNFSPTTPINEHSRLADGRHIVTSRREIKKPVGSKRSKTLKRRSDSGIAKKFQDLEETAIISDDALSLGNDGATETSTFADDIDEREENRRTAYNFKRNKRQTAALLSPNEAASVTDNSSRKKSRKVISSSSERYKNRRNALLAADISLHARRSASLELLPVSNGNQDKQPTTTTKSKTGEGSLKRVETDPHSTGKNFSKESKKTSLGKKSSFLRMISPYRNKDCAKLSLEVDGKDKETKPNPPIALKTRSGPKLQSHSFNEKSKSKKRTHQEFQESSRPLKRTNTVPTSVDKERLRRVKQASTAVNKPQEKNLNRNKKSKKKNLETSPAVLDAEKLLSEFEVIMALKAYNKAHADRLLPTVLKVPYTGKPRTASITEDSIIKGFDRKIITNQPQYSLNPDQSNEATSGLRTRPASMIGLKSLNEIRTKMALQNKMTSNDQLASNVSYFMLQSANEENGNLKLPIEPGDTSGNPNLSLNLNNIADNIAAPTKAADIFLQEDPLIDLEDELDDLGHDHKVTVPIYVCLIIITGYISGGAMLFRLWEDWDYIASSYFCFITLSTIGFGDIVPGTDMNKWASHEKLVLCTLWLAFGLSLLAMCFNLMQEGVKERCKMIGQKLGLLKNENNSL